MRLKQRKANGWRWDAGHLEPDPYCEVRVNAAKVAQSKGARNQFRLMSATSFSCRAGDQVRILVFDRDLKKPDQAGELRIIAAPGVTAAGSVLGQIDSYDLKIEAIPLRILRSK